MRPSRRFEFDTPGGTASFRHQGRGKPTPSFCQVMQWLAGAAIAHMGIEARARDPRVGDRVYGACGKAYVEVTAVIAHPRHESDPNGSFDVEYAHSTSAEITSATIGYWKKIITISLERGHTFHAVEDDEE